jgi:hypothetical protein
MGERLRTELKLCPYGWRASGRDAWVAPPLRQAQHERRGEPQDERDGTFSVEARLALGARGVCPTPDPFADLLIPRAEVIVAQDDIIYAA